MAPPKQAKSKSAKASPKTAAYMSKRPPRVYCFDDYLTTSWSSKPDPVTEPCTNCLRLQLLCSRLTEFREDEPCDYCVTHGHQQCEPLNGADDLSAEFKSLLMYADHRQKNVDDCFQYFLYGPTVDQSSLYRQLMNTFHTPRLRSVRNMFQISNTKTFMVDMPPIDTVMVAMNNWISENAQRYGAYHTFSQRDDSTTSLKCRFYFDSGYDWSPNERRQWRKLPLWQQVNLGGSTADWPWDSRATPVLSVYFVLYGESKLVTHGLDRNFILHVKKSNQSIPSDRDCQLFFRNGSLYLIPPWQFENACKCSRHDPAHPDDTVICLRNEFKIRVDDNVKTLEEALHSRLVSIFDEAYKRGLLTPWGQILDDVEHVDPSQDKGIGDEVAIVYLKQALVLPPLRMRQVPVSVEWISSSVTRTFPMQFRPKTSIGAMWEKTIHEEIEYVTWANPDYKQFEVEAGTVIGVICEKES